MASVTATCAIAPQQFPAGTPTAGVIRFNLLRASDNAVVQVKDVAPGNEAQFLSVPDGDYKVSAQRRATSTGAMLGSPVVSDTFSVDSTVTLDVPVSIGAPAVVI